MDISAEYAENAGGAQYDDKDYVFMLSGRWRFLCAHTVDNRRRLPPPQMAERILSDSKTAIFRYNIKRIGNVIREC